MDKTLVSFHNLMIANFRLVRRFGKNKAAALFLSSVQFAHPDCRVLLCAALFTLPSTRLIFRSFFLCNCARYCLVHCLVSFEAQTEYLIGYDTPPENHATPRKLFVKNYDVAVEIAPRDAHDCQLEKSLLTFPTLFLSHDGSARNRGEKQIHVQ
jgi:hypothetical protein